ncbi:MAG: sulfatase-like hydrolase/transferase [Spirochaetia bacterium]|nr:sulfatase-like hydrolase/transferase [Spirochaetia bacterium]
MPTTSPNPNQRPNILLITSDQQHWNTLGLDNPEIKTPRLDALARQGTLFTRAYCPDPTCTPSRSSIITGKYPSQHGAWSLGTRLSEKEPTVGAYLKDAGYRTALVGKAHFQPLGNTQEYPSLESYPLLQDLDYWRKFHGPFYGFDHVELARNHTDEAHVGQHYALWLEEKGLMNWRDHFQKPTGTRDPQRGAWSLPEKFHYNAWIAERSGALMEESKNKQEPFFLWASFFDPHPSYLIPEPWDKMYDPEKLTVPEAAPGEHAKNPPHFQLTQTKNPDFKPWQEKDGHWAHGFHSHLQDPKTRAENMAIYYGMTSCLDKYVGVVLDKLEALGLADNTLVVFTTDHGHLFGQHGLVAKGAFHYEDLIRLPFMARYPGNVPVGKRTAAIQSLVDLAPTFLDYAGVEVPRTMSGKTQRAVWEGKKESVRDNAVVEFHHQPTTIHLRTLVDSRHKITVYQNRDYGELFDLENDPGETNNLWHSAAHAALKSDLLLKLVSADLERVPMPMPRISGA